MYMYSEEKYLPFLCLMASINSSTLEMFTQGIWTITILLVNTDIYHHTQVVTSTAAGCFLRPLPNLSHLSIDGFPTQNHLIISWWYIYRDIKFQNLRAISTGLDTVRAVVNTLWASDMGWSILFRMLPFSCFHSHKSLWCFLLHCFHHGFDLPRAVCVDPSSK